MERSGSAGRRRVLRLVQDQEREGLTTVFGRRASFWLAVAGTSILANFGLELLADKVPSLGLSRFVAYTHRGPNNGGA